MFSLLNRGGVVGGASAGASIQASYLVRGQSSPDDNKVMMAKGHETGFGFFTNVAIDQHVDARERENDLAVVIKTHPELLGIGLDQGTSITVHADTVTVNGLGRVAVWDGKDHDGKGYRQLHAGDTLDTVTRVAVIAKVQHKVRNSATVDDFVDAKASNFNKVQQTSTSTPQMFQQQSLRINKNP
jgi:cyanophycinase